MEEDLPTRINVILNSFRRDKKRFPRFAFASFESHKVLTDNDLLVEGMFLKNSLDLEIRVYRETTFDFLPSYNKVWHIYKKIELPIFFSAPGFLKIRTNAHWEGYSLTNSENSL